jgi:alpha-N-arabinofuranosidase
MFLRCGKGDMSNFALTTSGSTLIGIAGMNRIGLGMPFQMIGIWRGLGVAAIALFPFCPIGAQRSPEVIGIHVNQPGARIAPEMFGIFFEDINFGADGGLYPERIKNRSFEFSEPLAGWSKIDNFAGQGELIIRSEDGLNEDNPHYLRLHIVDPAGFGISNAGFRGIGVRANDEYVFSAWVRVAGTGPKTMRATLLGAGRTKVGEATLIGFGGGWKKYEAVLKASATDPRAQIQLTFDGTGDIDLDMISLFPRNTWKNRPNGLRADLVQLLADMKPGFLRFPGGCIVEGRRLALRYQWKKTIGDISGRRAIVNRWNDEFSATRPAPDYYQSFGLGFYEYFQLAEDIGASPLPILNCGMACQFNSSELVPIDQLDPYIQDALDLIEFANGGPDTKWGGLRSAMGHPEPFHMKMLGVGNEQWGPAYLERYKVFNNAIKSKHPEITIITSAGPFPEGPDFEYLWKNMRTLKADIIDEHYYRAPQWFLDHADRYDKYDRNGPKVFAGEYAAQTAAVASTANRNTWGAAMAEAAFMTGLERNADLVRMASYAPLFAHVDEWQWTPDLIWYDNLRSYGTPNYYVQKLFSTNLGSRILPVTIGGSPQNAQKGLYASASLDEKSGEVILKAVNSGDAARAVKVLLGGMPPKRNSRAMVLASGNLKAENSLDQPKNVAPVESNVAVTADGVELSLQPYSLTVLRMPVR